MSIQSLLTYRFHRTVQTVDRKEPEPSASKRPLSQISVCMKKLWQTAGENAALLTTPCEEYCRDKCQALGPRISSEEEFAQCEKQCKIAQAQYISSRID